MTRDAVNAAVAELVGLLQTELRDTAPEFRQRAEELKDAAVLNAQSVLDGSISPAQGAENVRLLGEALRSELGVAGYRAKAKMAGFAADAVGIVLRLVVGAVRPA